MMSEAVIYIAIWIAVSTWLYMSMGAKNQDVSDKVYICSLAGAFWPITIIMWLTISVYTLTHKNKCG